MTEKVKFFLISSLNQNFRHHYFINTFKNEITITIIEKERENREEGDTEKEEEKRRKQEYKVWEVFTPIGFSGPDNCLSHSFYNPSTPRRTQVSPITEISILF